MKKQYNFPREHRLITKFDFNNLFNKSRKISQQNLVLIVKTNSKEQARLGLVVGKKTAKSAVVRNRIKRVIRESFRKVHNQLKKVDIIVIARKPCEKLNKEKIRESIDKLWEKLLV